MGILKRSSETPKRIDLDQEGSYIEVTEEITKRQFNALIEAMPENIEDKGISAAEGTKLQATLFETFVKGWSLGAAPTVEEYLDLPNTAASAIDSALMDHFNSMNVGEPDQKKRRR